MSLPALFPRLSRLVLIAATGLLVLALPLNASAHSELQSATPAEGAAVPSPFGGPLVLTFSEALADGSKADLIAPDGSTAASATIDAAGATMTFSLATALAPGGYEVRWVSIADDGDLLRGTVKFAVDATASTPAPLVSASAAPATPAASPASPAASPGSPAPSPASPSDPSGGSDVVLPIVIALVIAALGAFYLVRRNRTA